MAFGRARTAWAAGALAAAALVGAALLSRDRRDTLEPAPASDPNEHPAGPISDLNLWRLAGGALAVVVLLAAGFAYWSYQQSSERKEIAIAMTGGEPERAPDLIRRYGCGGCHTISGVPGADGQVAAPLDGLVSRVYVGGVARNTADNLVRWIVDPQSLSPRTAMPVTGISEQEARDVAAFLYAQ
jgi:cytochrome c2